MEIFQNGKNLFKSYTGIYQVSKTTRYADTCSFKAIVSYFN